MPSETLRPHAVTMLGGTPAIVGAPPQWADDSDATYAQMTKVITDRVIRSDATNANLDRLAATPATVTGIVAYMRARATSPNANMPVRANLASDSVGWFTLMDDALQEWSIPADVAAATYSVEVTPALLAQQGTTLANVASILAAEDIRVTISQLGSTPLGSTHDLYVYEFWVEVTYGGLRRPAHNRIVQRGNDGLGLTGGQRVVQRRTIQSSNRAIGIR